MQRWVFWKHHWKVSHEIEVPKMLRSFERFKENRLENISKETYFWWSYIPSTCNFIKKWTFMVLGMPASSRIPNKVAIWKSNVHDFTEGILLHLVRLTELTDNWSLTKTRMNCLINITWYCVKLINKTNRPMGSAVWKYTVKSIKHSTCNECGHYRESLLMSRLFDGIALLICMYAFLCPNDFMF